MDDLIQYITGNIFPENVTDFIFSNKLAIKKNHNIYLKYASLFCTETKNINNNNFVKLINIAGFLYYLSVIKQDEKFDNVKKDDNKYIYNYLLTNNLQEESIKILSNLFENSSVFWTFWNKRKLKYFDALLNEKLINKSIPYSKYTDIAINKSAFGKVAIDAMCIFLDKTNSEEHKALLTSHDFFSIGVQIIDDIQDLTEDYNNKQFNWAYNKTILKLKRKKVLNAESFDINTIKKLFYLEGIAVDLYKKALQNFTQARIVISKYEYINWSKLIEKKEFESKNYISKIQGFITIETAKKQLLNIEPNIKVSTTINDRIEKFNDKSIANSLKYLISEFEKGNNEMKHLIYLDEIDGFKNKTKLHIGDVFQRAILIDIYCDIIENLNFKEIQEILNQEIKFIVDSRLKTKIGGWSYFPTCKEISADADDLGQIIQIFKRTSNENLIEKYCKKPINILLKERTTNDGVIETWILPKNKLNLLEKQQDYYNRTKWGKGPDNEVVANFIYGLTLFDKEKYKNQINLSVSFLFRNQSVDGFWLSRWYYGNYYGTYVCLRLFKKLNIQNENIDKAMNFIMNSQKSDGGWGLNEKSDPLNTAFSLLCLLLYKVESKKIKKAVKYLKNAQLKNGSWVAVDFIKPKTNEPYKSKTITTAYVLKALTIYEKDEI